MYKVFLKVCNVCCILTYKQQNYTPETMLVKAFHSYSSVECSLMVL